jgi:hypothetical protein
MKKVALTANCRPRSEASRLPYPQQSRLTGQAIVAPLVAGVTMFMPQDLIIDCSNAGCKGHYYSASVPQYSHSWSRSGRHDFSDTKGREWSSRGYTFRSSLFRAVARAPGQGDVRGQRTGRPTNAPGRAGESDGSES